VAGRRRLHFAARDPAPGDGDTFDAETERLPSLGAHRLRDLQRDKARWTTFADIEGNESDLIAG
jgi:hypothetical protein